MTTTPDPTMPPPQIVQSNDPPMLVPVTGADLTAANIRGSQLQHLLGSLGLAFFGLGLIFTGLEKRRTQ
ncbi:MAG: hypothetical protein R6V73_12085 [Anaerolineales bacterium]